MTDSADLRFLLAIRDNGSLVATARALDLTPSAVSQRLQQLEKKLGTRLIDRTARSLRFTQEGALLCERGAELIRQLDALSEDLHTRRGGLVGTLKVNAPLGFGRRYVAPIIADFQQQHPDVDIELALSDAPLSRRRTALMWWCISAHCRCRIWSAMRLRRTHALSARRPRL